MQLQRLALQRVLAAAGAPLPDTSALLVPNPKTSSNGASWARAGAKGISRQEWRAWACRRLSKSARIVADIPVTWR